GREEEEIEEDRLHDRRDLDVELADQHAGQQRAHNDPKTEAPELEAPDQEANREREEDRQFRIMLQGPHNIFHTVSPRVSPEWLRAPAVALLKLSFCSRLFPNPGRRSGLTGGC